MIIWLKDFILTDPRGAVAKALDCILEVRESEI